MALETLLKVVKGGEQAICWRCGRCDCAACKKLYPADNSKINVSSFTNKDVLVIDSVSQLAESIMNHILRKDIALGKEDVKPEWDHYRMQGFLMDRIFSIIQQSNYKRSCNFSRVHGRDGG